MSAILLREPTALPQAVYYPESDGEPMGETDLHRKLIFTLIYLLDTFFRSQPETYVTGDIMLYYVEGNPRKMVSPDVMVVRGVGKHDRRIYKLWEEKQVPQVVIEISSRKTWGDDLQKKWRLYEQLGVAEYYIFDPEYDYLAEPFMAYRLSEGELTQAELTDGRIHSPALGLDFVDTGETLRLFNPATQTLLLTPDEEHAARLAAEAEIERLRGELDRLRTIPQS